MFLLISRRLHGQRMGMDVFAMGNLLLGCAYVLQLVEGGPTWSTMSVVNHVFTLAAPIAYWIGAMRFFGYSSPLWRPLAVFALTYAAVQWLVQWNWGPTARYAMLSGMSVVVFVAMTLTAIQGARTFAKDLYWEMVFFALLIGGIGGLNALKFAKILSGGLEALDMDSGFQTVFYIYMCSLATVAPPAIIWLVLRRLTEDLSRMAARDPMTQLLNRRGLAEALRAYFSLRTAAPAYLLLLDVDHFKRINDAHGHQAGDAVLCHVADVLRTTVRQGDLTGRIGGEEFVAICLDSNPVGVAHLAERLRAAVENHGIPVNASGTPLHCTVTIGVSHQFTGPDDLEGAMRDADAALYRGKVAGRNRIELASASFSPGSAAGPDPSPLGRAAD
jgi:diguanylate cyclase (GGDEF)-like protein